MAVAPGQGREIGRGGVSGNAAGGVGRGEISPSEDSGVEPRKLFLCVRPISVVQACRTEDRSDGMGVHGELRPPKRDAQWGREPLRSAALQLGGWLRLVHADWEIGAAGREASRECCEVGSGVNLTRTGSDSKSRPPSPRPSPPGEREEYLPRFDSVGRWLRVEHRPVNPDLRNRNGERTRPACRIGRPAQSLVSPF